MIKEVRDKYHNWIYQYDKIEGDPIPKGVIVLPNVKKSIPKTLCKYYPIAKHNIQALRNKYFYGSHPDQLNDPFDTNYKMLQLNKDELFIYNVLFSFYGILSMTESDTDPLMWSHYCSHNGFAVNYSLNKIPKNFLGPFPINYINDFEPINNEDLYLKIIIGANIKFRQFWESENEWRFLLLSSHAMKLPKYLQCQLPSNTRSRKSRYFYYSDNFSIEEIVLGYKLFRNDYVTIKKDKVKKEDGFEFKLKVNTNENELFNLLNLIRINEYNTSLIDLNPNDHKKFIKRGAIIEPCKRNSYKLTYLND
jgi:hypothetical protein